MKSGKNKKGKKIELMNLASKFAGRTLTVRYDNQFALNSFPLFLNVLII